MDTLKNIKIRTILKTFSLIAIINLLSILVIYEIAYFKIWPVNKLVIIISIVINLFLILLIILNSLSESLEPLKFISQTIIHLNDNNDIEQPDINQLKLAHDLIDNLNRQLLNIVNNAKNQTNDNQFKILDFIIKNLPLPLFILNPKEEVIYVNQQFCQYFNLKIDDILHNNINNLLNFIFSDQENINSWLSNNRNKAITNYKIFERVKLNLQNNLVEKQFDLAGYFNNNNELQIESIFLIFDRTRQYQQDDQAISYVALSVHELRTPLTLLRGYIEVLKEELSSNPNRQINNFLIKMDATAQQLTAFVNNVLNVSRIDNDQLNLNIREEDWQQILTETINNLQIRAKVRGLTINLEIQKNLPKVAIDQLSTIEVVSNLIDNAIKYSNQSKIINVKSYLNDEGMVETCVIDYGFGIPDNLLSHIFTKYYRDHHNRSQIGGTGLGLYLSRSVIKAEFGNIWVRSSVGKGSAFYFTIMPIDKFKTLNPSFSFGQDFTSTSHGWIKNHDLYRE